MRGQSAAHAGGDREIANNTATGSLSKAWLLDGAFVLAPALWRASGVREMDSRCRTMLGV